MPPPHWVSPTQLCTHGFAWSAPFTEVGRHSTDLSHLARSPSTTFTRLAHAARASVLPPWAEYSSTAQPDPAHPFACYGTRGLSPFWMPHTPATASESRANGVQPCKESAWLVPMKGRRKGATVWHATELKETPSPSLFLLHGSLAKGHSPPHTRSLHICSPAEATDQDTQDRGDQLRTPQAGLQGEANKVPVGPRLSGETGLGGTRYWNRV